MSINIPKCAESISIIEHPDQEDTERAEQTRPQRVEYVAGEILAKALVPVAERLGPREPLGTPCDFVEFIKLN